MMNADTGRQMAFKAHIAQSIKNILFTRLGTRVQREEYGSLLPDLLDMPLTPAVVMLCHAAAVTAIAEWEPRIIVRRIEISAEEAGEGRLKIRLDTELPESGQAEIFEMEV
ncbi:MAG: GPW/gp25 family protein [Neisseria sp.]|nr:GPW/gp25 family protein [Neisseria sp.]